MKKLFVMLCAAVALFACQKVQPVMVEVTPEELPSTPMTFNLTVSQAEADATKALKSGWEVGDVVYVFFKGIPAKYLQLSYDGTAWTKTECNADPWATDTFDEADFSGIPDTDKLMTALYFPRSNVTLSYELGDAAFYIGYDADPIYYMMAEDAAYTVSGKEVRGTLTMTKPEGYVQFFVPGISEEDAPLYRLRETRLRSGFLQDFSWNTGADYIWNNFGYSCQGIFYDNGTDSGVLFAGYLDTAGTETDYAFQLVKYVSATKACAEGTFEIKGNKTINAGVVVRFPELSHTAWTYGKWVDMGPAGRWATGNLTDDGSGSGSIVAPDEAGKYYAWGETVGYEPNGSGEFAHSFDWANYELANGAGDKLTRYCNDAWFGNEDFTDGLTELTSDDDAATKNLGSAWRMPTEAECSKLVDPYYFSWDWQTGTSDGYAIGGHLVTCHATGLSLFLPAAWYGDYSSLELFGDFGYYWASSLYTYSPTSAFYLCVYSGNVYVSNAYRRNGLSVRPVTE